MDKEYLSDLRKWVDEKKGQNGKTANPARVVFLAIRNDVMSAIEAGYPMKTIWEHMHETGRVNTTYETFRRHVNRFIKQQKPLPSAKNLEARITSQRIAGTPSDSPEPAKLNEKNASMKTDVKRGSELPGFNFKPPSRK
ncbi:TraK family protein [Pantoea agglomerans]|uniref:TraK family protein n=1 Tax=Enterobacter agglomerans TaxID=549 RepID=UPI00320B8EBC